MLTERSAVLNTLKSLIETLENNELNQIVWGLYRELEVDFTTFDVTKNALDSMKDCRTNCPLLQRYDPAFSDEVDKCLVGCGMTGCAGDLLSSAQ